MNATSILYSNLPVYDIIATAMGWVVPVVIGGLGLGVLVGIAIWSAILEVQLRQQERENQQDQQ